MRRQERSLNPIGVSPIAQGSAEPWEHKHQQRNNPEGVAAIRCTDATPSGLNYLESFHSQGWQANPGLMAEPRWGSYSEGDIFPKDSNIVTGSNGIRPTGMGLPYSLSFSNRLLRAWTLWLAILFSSFLSAQGLQATLLLANQTVVEGALMRRQPGTTVVQFQPRGSESLRSLNLEEIETIFFNLGDFNPPLLQQAFQSGQYDEVIDGLKGRIVPYFSYSDQNTNSNRLVMLFIRALYRTGNTGGVKAARDEVAKYAADGDVRRLAEMLHALRQLEEGEVEAFDSSLDWFTVTETGDPLTAMALTGQARRARLDEDWNSAYPLYARVITETPLVTPWSWNALYQTAQYHQLNTNLVVAYQIAQELETVTSLEEWEKRADDLQDTIRRDAERFSIELKEFSEPHSESRRSETSEIDYRKRQRELEESTQPAPSP